MWMIIIASLFLSFAMSIYLTESKNYMAYHHDTIFFLFQLKHYTIYIHMLSYCVPTTTCHAKNTFSFFPLSLQIFSRKREKRRAGKQFSQEDVNNSIGKSLTSIFSALLSLSLSAYLSISAVLYCPFILRRDMNHYKFEI